MWSMVVIYEIVANGATYDKWMSRPKPKASITSSIRCRIGSSGKEFQPPVISWGVRTAKWSTYFDDLFIWTGSGWWFGWHVLFSQKYWEANHPNWRTHIFQRGGTQPPTRMKFMVILQFASRDEFPEDALPILAFSRRWGKDGCQRCLVQGGNDEHRPGGHLGLLQPWRVAWHKKSPKKWTICRYQGVAADILCM